MYHQTSGNQSLKAARNFDKYLKVVHLRAQGMSFDDIAKEVGYSRRSSCLYAFWRGIQLAYKEDVDEIRAIENARLDKMMEVYWADHDDPAMIDNILRVIWTRVLVNGLYPPRYARVKRQRKTPATDAMLEQVRELYKVLGGDVKDLGE